MKNGIEDKKYYELLEWKDSNLTLFGKIYKDQRLCDLNPVELMDLCSNIEYIKPDSESMLKLDDIMKSNITPEKFNKLLEFISSHSDDQLKFLLHKHFTDKSDTRLMLICINSVTDIGVNNVEIEKAIKEFDLDLDINEDFDMSSDAPDFKNISILSYTLYKKRILEKYK